MTGAASPAVVLVRPREEGNVGAAARAMANMGLERLVLVEPAAAFGPTARAFAVGAGHLLDRAERTASLAEALAPFRLVVGTTSARDRRLGVPHLAPRELPAWLDRADPGGDAPTALVFGPEVGGLTNDELALAGAIVVVPCAPVQPTLNLAQAVLVLAYELYVSRRARLAHEAAPEVTPAAEPPATAGELEGLLGHVAEVAGAAGFDRDDSYAGVMRDLRGLAARALPTGREVAILRGLCRRVLRTIERRAGAGG